MAIERESKIIVEKRDPKIVVILQIISKYLDSNTQMPFNMNLHHNQFVAVEAYFDLHLLCMIIAYLVSISNTQEMRRIKQASPRSDQELGSSNWYNMHWKYNFGKICFVRLSFLI